MERTCIRWLLFAGFAAFVPLFYYLAVVGGLLPYGGILLIAMRNPSNSSILLFSLIHLTIYGFAFYWLAGLVAHAMARLTRPHAWLATAVVLLLLAGVGAMPIYGVAHGRIHWTSAYELYGSDRLR
jgi:hypothetical protein